MFKQFIKQDAGATAIEYVLIASAVCTAIAATVYLFGDQVVALFNLIGEQIARV